MDNSQWDTFSTNTNYNGYRKYRCHSRKLYGLWQIYGRVQCDASRRHPCEDRYSPGWRWRGTHSWWVDLNYQYLLALSENTEVEGPKLPDEFIKVIPHPHSLDPTPTIILLTLSPSLSINALGPVLYCVPIFKVECFCSMDSTYFFYEFHTFPHGFHTFFHRFHIFFPWIPHIFFMESILFFFHNILFYFIFIFIK